MTRRSTAMRGDATLVGRLSKVVPRRGFALARSELPLPGAGGGCGGEPVDS